MPCSRASSGRRSSAAGERMKPWPRTPIHAVIPTGVSGPFPSSVLFTDIAALGRLGLTTTEVLAGSNAEPTRRVRGCASVGAADRSMTNSVAQPQTRKPHRSLRNPEGFGRAFMVNPSGMGSLRLPAENGK